MFAGEKGEKFTKDFVKSDFLKYQNLSFLSHFREFQQFQKKKIVQFDLILSKLLLEHDIFKIDLISWCHNAQAMIAWLPLTFKKIALIFCMDN